MMTRLPAQYPNRTTGARPRTSVRGGKRRSSWPLSVYRDLFDAWGPQHWWPGETADEMAIGAILTQNTAWTNVEKAIGALKECGRLDLRALAETTAGDLAPWIRPAGYFNVKARRLKALADAVVREGGLERVFRRSDGELRAFFLGIHGIGPETADSILLYAARRPVFVIDAYTRRVLVRHGWATDTAGYGELAELFMKNLPADAALFNEYHALFVRLGKTFCRPQPRCAPCPLRRYLRAGPADAGQGRETRGRRAEA